MGCAFSVLSKKSLLNPRIPTFFFYLMFLEFRGVCILHLELCVCVCAGRGEGREGGRERKVSSVSRFFFLFVCGYSVIPAPSVGKSPFPIDCFCSLVKHQLTSFVWGIFLGFLFCYADLFIYSFTNITLSLLSL